MAGRFIVTYNGGDHRTEPHARIDDWLAHLPADGVRQMCAWERFCAFAREPERRQVGIDCRLTVAGVAYEVDPELAGETVVVWWGLFDQELWVERGDERFGPFPPVGGAIPLHRYRKHRKSRREIRADQVAALADRLELPRAAVSGEDGVVVIRPAAPAVAVRPFRDPTRSTNLPSPARSPPGAPLPTRSGCRSPSCRMRIGPSSTRCWPGRWRAPRSSRRSATISRRGCRGGSDGC